MTKRNALGVDPLAALIGGPDTPAINTGNSTDNTSITGAAKPRLTVRLPSADNRAIIGPGKANPKGRLKGSRNKPSFSRLLNRSENSWTASSTTAT